MYMAFPCSKYYQLIRLPPTYVCFLALQGLKNKLFFVNTSQGLPRSYAIQSGYMPSVETPRKLQPITITQSLMLPSWGSQPSRPSRFYRFIGATYLFTFVMACPTSVYASHLLFGVDLPSVKYATLEFLSTG